MPDRTPEQVAELERLETFIGGQPFLIIGVDKRDWVHIELVIPDWRKMSMLRAATVLFSMAFHGWLRVFFVDLTIPDPLKVRIWCKRQRPGKAGEKC